MPMTMVRFCSAGCGRLLNYHETIEAMNSVIDEDGMCRFCKAKEAGVKAEKKYVVIRANQGERI